MTAAMVSTGSRHDSSTPSTHSNFNTRLNELSNRSTGKDKKAASERQRSNSCAANGGQADGRFKLTRRLQRWWSASRDQAWCAPNSIILPTRISTGNLDKYCPRGVRFSSSSIPAPTTITKVQAWLCAGRESTAEFLELFYSHTH